MGAFDDLIPQQPAPQPAAQPGAFDDLIPANHSLAGVAATGAVQGVGDVVGLPDTGAALLTLGNDKLRQVIGAPTSKESKAYYAKSQPAPAGAGRFANIPQAVRETAKEPDKKPVSEQVDDWIFANVPFLTRDEAKTDAERLLQMGVRGATGAALLPGGGLVGRTVSGAAGGVASEKAGQLTKGTKIEPYARMLAGLIAGGVTGYALNRQSGADALLNRSLEGYTEQDFQAARDLIANARAQGVDLTAAEALAQVRGGNTPLMSIQRYVENNPVSAPQMTRFMNRRGAANAGAVDDLLNDVGPANAQPTEVGANVQRAAQGQLDDIRQAINAEARPFYDQAMSQNDQLVGLGVNPYQGQAWDDLTGNPAFRQALAQVRDDPLNTNLANLPDYDLSVLDAVKKRMDLNAGRATNPGIGVQPDTTTAAAYTAANRQLKDLAGGFFDDYATARAIGAEGRQTRLEPAGRAPIGQLARTADTAAQQNVLLPKLASDASPRQVGEAVRNLVDQGAAEDAQALVRLKLQDLFDTALPNVKGSAEQFRGANFANLLTRYQNQRAALEAAVRALPNGEEVWPRLQQVIDAFTAQGQRLPVGSATEFNRLISEAASQGGGLASLPLRAGKTVMDLGRDVLQRYALRSTANELAGTLLNPNGVDQLLRLSRRGTGVLTRQGSNLLLNYQRAQSPKN